MVKKMIKQKIQHDHDEKKQLSKLLTEEQFVWFLQYSEARNFTARDFLFIHDNLSRLSYPQILKQLPHFKSKDQLYTIAKNLQWKKTPIIFNRTKYFEPEGEAITSIEYFREQGLIRPEIFKDFQQYIESSKFTLYQMRIVIEGLKCGYNIWPLHRQTRVSVNTIYKWIKRFALKDERVLAFDYLPEDRSYAMFINILNDKLRGYPDDKYIDKKYGINVALNQLFKSYLKQYGVEQFFANDFNASNLSHHLKYNYFLPLSQRATEFITGTLLGDSSLRIRYKGKNPSYRLPAVDEKQYKEAKDFFLNLRASNKQLSLEDIKALFPQYKEALGN